MTHMPPTTDLKETKQDTAKALTKEPRLVSADALTQMLADRILMLDVVVTKGASVRHTASTIERDGGEFMVLRIGRLMVGLEMGVAERLAHALMNALPARGFGEN